MEKTAPDARFSSVLHRLVRLLGQLCTALLWVLAALLLVLNLAARGGNGVPLGPYRAIFVLTGSMSPAIMPDDMLLVRQVEPRDIQPGDVITYHPASEGTVMVTHRVVSVQKDEGFLITQGDANNSPDAPVLFQNLVGRVVYVVPRVGYLARFLRSPYGILCLAVLFGAGVLIRKIWLQPEDEDADHGQ